jgi:hypothetical protein
MKFRLLWWRAAMAATLSGACVVLASAATPEPVRVLVVGTYHFSNPGRDLHNMQADDVLAPRRQTEVEAVATALARFEPSLVAVEWPKALTDERYAAFRAGTLEPSRNEVVQLGFRLAALRGLERVHGIDVDGDFPFEPVQAWVAANGRRAELDALMLRTAALVERMGAMQATHSIGALLRWMNSPAQVRESRQFYLALLRFGAGDVQPGVDLNTAWSRRNYAICANLLQAVRSGDRVVLFYGAGHTPDLQRCVLDTPGFELVDALDYLPQ